MDPYRRRRCHAVGIVQFPCPTRVRLLSEPIDGSSAASYAGALWRDGHVLMRGLLDGGTVASLKPSLAEAVERYRAEWPTQVLKKQESASEDAQFDRIFSVRLKSKAGEALASSARLASAAAALLGVHCVRFYQDQLFVKVSIH